MKNKVLKSDLMIAKAFLNTAYPHWVIELQLVMDIDYISGLCYRFISGKPLNYNLVDLEPDQLSEIEAYLNTNGNVDDVLFYKLVLLIQLLLHKYYNHDGTFRHQK